MRPGLCPLAVYRMAWLCLLGGLLLLGGVKHSPAQDEPGLVTMRQQLNGPVQLLLANGSRNSGQITHWDGRELRLEITLDAGQAEMTYAASDIREIVFPGGDYLGLLSEWMQDPDRVDHALELFQAFYEQRGPYLNYLKPADHSLFVEYVRFALQQGQPERAIALVEVLRPIITDPAQIESLDDALLLASFQSGRYEEAVQRAEAWIESAPRAGESALGWRILAEIHFRNKNYEACFWTALYPIAFAHQILPDHLDLCYAFAVAAAHENRQLELTERLTQEMSQRGLAWPTQHALLETYRPRAPVPSSEEVSVDPAEPIQNPSPLDPLESLPTRIKQPVEKEYIKGTGPDPET